MSKGKIIALVAVLAILIPVMYVCNTAGWFVRNAVQTARAEFSPQELLRKYEWFKNASASLDKKRADVTVYQGRVEDMKEMYEGTARKDWDRTDKETYSQWTGEVAGVKASYNQLASEYNSQMAKFNWQFCNAGTLPKGATEVLPREFRTYITD